MLSQVNGLQWLAVGFGIFGFVVRIGQMMIRLDHCWSQRQSLASVGMLQTEVEQTNVDAVVAVAAARAGLAELVESFIKR